MKDIYLNSSEPLNEEIIEKFEKYADLLLEYNEKFNITAIREREEVINKHFLDSIEGKKFISGKTLVDIGSGGGFPILPLKIVCPDLSVTAVDSNNKKCGFILTVAKELGLKNVNALSLRAEDIGKNPKFREKFDICSARAVAELNILCEYCLPLVKVGGVFLAYKNKSPEELEKAKNAIKVLGGKIKEIYEYGDNRNIIVIEKIKNTELKYPRNNGQIRKKPL